MTAIAVFHTSTIVGDAVATQKEGGTQLVATFTKLPEGKHGFHIHVAGDLRGEGCAGACEHFHVGPPTHHGDKPKPGSNHKARHTGDLGNIELTGVLAHYKYFLEGITPMDLWGRSLIVHEDEDDLGKGVFEDSLTTGHSGKRIGCAIFGRGASCNSAKPMRVSRTRKVR